MAKYAKALVIFLGLLFGLYLINIYFNNLRFYSFINSEPECIRYEITFDGVKKLGLSKDINQHVNANSPFAIDGEFCRDHLIYERFSKLVRSAHYSPWYTNNIDIETFFFSNPAEKEQNKNNYISYAIGENWISFCQQVDSFGETSCTVYTLDNASVVIDALLLDIKKLIVEEAK